MRNTARFAGKGQICILARSIGITLVMGLLFLSSCGGPNVCDCKTEAAKENPDREFMADCEELYKGKAFEEIEAELEQCGK